MLNAQDIERIGATTYGDLLRPVAGVDVSNFGQGGIGYGIAIRGFTDGEHGRDIGFILDGVPNNEVSSINSPGYNDLNVLIPETVDQIDIVRGPFDIEHGDDSVGGTVNIVTKNSQPFSTIGASGGSYDFYRAVGVTGRAAEGPLGIASLMSAEFVNDGGYRENSQFRHVNLFSKFTLPAADGELSLRIHFFGGAFGAPGYASLSDVQSGVVNERTATDPTDGGYKYLGDFVAHYTSGPAASALDLTSFVSIDTTLRAANFGGGQNTGQEDRVTSGGSVRKIFTTTVATFPTQFLVGADVRADVVDVVRYPSIAQRPSGFDSLRAQYDEERVGGYAQFQVKPVSWAKVTVGSRYDQIFYNIRDHLTPSNSTAANSGLFSPKVGVSLNPLSTVEFYANYGEGFRSLSAIDEVLGNPALKPLKVRGEEGGVRVTTIPRVVLGVDVWETNISNEAFQVDPFLPVQNLGQSERSGIDIESRFAAIDTSASNLSVFANLSLVRARLLGQGTSIFVPNVPRSIAQLGADFGFALPRERRLDGSVRVDLIGRKDLSLDGGLQSNAYERVSGKLTFGFTRDLSLFAQTTWYPGTGRRDEAIFNFGANTGALPTDVFFSAQPRVTVQGGFTLRFNTGV